jgi:hypothetical protein
MNAGVAGEPATAVDAMQVEYYATTSDPTIAARTLSQGEGRI